MHGLTKASIEAQGRHHFSDAWQSRRLLKEDPHGSTEGGPHRRSWAMGRELAL
jgi:hypothetical protein